jgi:hypothetical protein
MHVYPSANPNLKKIEQQIIFQPLASPPSLPQNPTKSKVQKKKKEDKTKNQSLSSPSLP